MWMLRRDTVVLCETSGSMHRSKHVSLKSKGDVSVRENKYPMAMKSLGWNLRTAERSRARVFQLWVTLPRAAVPWCSWTDPKDPTSLFQTSLTVQDTATELLVGFFFKEKGRLMWKDGLQSQPKYPLRYWLYLVRAHLKSAGGHGRGWHVLSGSPHLVPHTIVPQRPVPEPLLAVRNNPGVICAWHSKKWPNQACGS